MAEAENADEIMQEELRQLMDTPSIPLAPSFSGISDNASTISSSYSIGSTDTAMTTDSSGKLVRRRKLIKKTTTELGGMSVETIKFKKRKRGSKRADMVANWATIDFREWKCLGGGALGIKELQDHIPETNDVYLFGMVQIKIGSGRFEKCKNMFIEFNGVNCKPMTRMLAGGKRNEVHKILGECHAQVVFEKREEVNIRNIFAQIGHLFVAENIQGSRSVFSTSTTTVEEIEKAYERQMAEKAAEYLEKQRNMAKERPVVKPKIDRITEILNLLHEDMGWVNWVLFKATEKKLKLLHEESFGSGTIFALRQNLKDNDVLFGLLRLSFGEMPYRRTHFVLLHWVGPKTKNVKRGKLNARAERMAKMLEPWGIKLELKGAEQITVANIIHRVRNIVVVDGGDDEDPEEVIEQKLIEEFNKALAEEESANQNKDRTLKADKQEEEEVEEVGSPTSGGAGIAKSPKTSSKDDVKKVEKTITETITLVSDRDADVNWILLQPIKKKKKHKKKRKKKKAFALGS